MLGDTAGGGAMRPRGEMVDLALLGVARAASCNTAWSLLGLRLGVRALAHISTSRGPGKAPLPLGRAVCCQVPGIGLGEQEFTCDDRILSGYKIWRREMGLIAILLQAALVKCLGCHMDVTVVGDIPCYVRTVLESRLAMLSTVGRHITSMTRASSLLPIYPEPIRPYRAFKSSFAAVARSGSCFRFCGCFFSLSSASFFLLSISFLTIAYARSLSTRDLNKLSSNGLGARLHEPPSPASPF